MPEKAAPDKRMRARLASDEFLAGQVALALVRGRVRARAGRASAGGSKLAGKALKRPASH